MHVEVNLSLLDAVCAVADAAAAKIMQIYSGEFEVSRKSDNSPVTEADLAADDIIRKGLADFSPDVPVLSEEGALPNPEERHRWPTYWLVDPLDGTRGFAERNGEFGVNIALIREHSPELGVVCAPVSGDCYRAGTGIGAFKRTGRGSFVPIQTRSRPTVPHFVRSRSRLSRRTDLLIAHMGEVTSEQLGSSLKGCLVAEGRADFSPAFGPTSEWDTAAVQCVLEVAGGSLLDAQSFEPLSYNRGSSLENPRYFICGQDRGFWKKQIVDSGCLRKDR